jgi:hypothetical protein
MFAHTLGADNRLCLDIQSKPVMQHVFEQETLNTYKQSGLDMPSLDARKIFLNAL